jgi:hypothetical protein
MLVHIAEWAGAVLAAGMVAGMVAGLMVLVAGAAGVWLLYRRLRRHLEAVTSTVGRYAFQATAVMAGMRQGRLPPQVVYHLRRRLRGAPGTEVSQWPGG